MLTGRTGLEYGQELRRLPGTPWSIRSAAASAGRAALEIYAFDDLIDVIVAQSVAPLPLRGARRVPWAGLPCCLARGLAEPG
jgi:hypothetical protein